MQSLDIRRRSASTEAPPQVRQSAIQVAKLIDVSKCIGCKACQAACLEWNDLKAPIGYTDGTYNNPTDPTPTSWTVMRFAEHENGDDLEWLIRKDGCMHCDDPGCLEGLPGAGCDRAVHQRHRRLRVGELHRLRLLREGLSLQRTAVSPRSIARPTSARSASIVSRSARHRPAPRPARPRRSISARKRT